MDFLMPGRGGAVALVECKAGRTVTPAMAAPMQRLAEALKRKRAKAPARTCFSSIGHRRREPSPAVAPGVRALPWREFLDEL